MAQAHDHWPLSRMRTIWGVPSFVIFCYVFLCYTGYRILWLSPNDTFVRMFHSVSNVKRESFRLWKVFCVWKWQIPLCLVASFPSIALPVYPKMALLPNEYYILVTCPEVVTISDNQCSCSISPPGGGISQNIQQNITNEGLPQSVTRTPWSWSMWSNSARLNWWSYLIEAELRFIQSGPDRRILDLYPSDRPSAEKVLWGRFHKGRSQRKVEGSQEIPQICRQTEL